MPQYRITTYTPVTIVEDHLVTKETIEQAVEVAEADARNQKLKVLVVNGQQCTEKLFNVGQISSTIRE